MGDEGHRQALARCRAVLHRLYGDKAEWVRRNPRFRALITPVVNTNGANVKAVQALNEAVKKETK